MDTLTDSLTSLNDAFAEAVSALQSQVVSFHRDAAAAVAKAGELPPLVPTVEPLVALDALVGRSYDYQVKQLESNKQFALDLIDAWTPKATPARSPRSAK
jgi:hypothetical protein